MSETERKASNAARLMMDETFKDALKELQDNAISVFSSPTSSEAEIIAAHENIRAASTVLGVLQRWIDDKAVADKSKERSAPL